MVCDAWQKTSGNNAVLGVVGQKQDLHGALRLMKSLTCQHLVKNNYSWHSGS